MSFYEKDGVKYKLVSYLAGYVECLQERKVPVISATTNSVLTDLRPVVNGEIIEIEKNDCSGTLSVRISPSQYDYHVGIDQNGFNVVIDGRCINSVYIKTEQDHNKYKLINRPSNYYKLTENIYIDDERVDENNYIFGKTGDYLCSSGYIVSKAKFNRDYEAVSPKQEIKTQDPSSSFHR